MMYVDSFKVKLCKHHWIHKLRKSKCLNAKCGIIHSYMIHRCTKCGIESEMIRIYGGDYK